MNRLTLKKIYYVLVFLMIISSIARASATDTLKYSVFGKVIVYKPATGANAVVLFISGENGWNKGEADMARQIVSQGAIVVGIDCRNYFKRLKNQSLKCYYPAGDLEELSMFLQKKYKLSQYFKPILIGYSSGASMVYGALAQAPANTFKGALSLAFTPAIKSNKPLCAGSGLKQHKMKDGSSNYLEASDKLTAPFLILHGSNDKVYPLAESQQFIKGVNTGQLIELPNMGHDFEASSTWLPQFTQAYKKIMAAPSFAEQKAAQNAPVQSQKLEPLPADFPVIAIPTAIKDTLPMVFFISGDGGWTSFDNSLAEALAAKGMPVAGLDAQKYFWNAKTPAETAVAVSKAVQHYMQQWNKKKFILAGYSFGACVVPFIANLLPAQLKESMDGVYSLSPDETADFEIHISDMLNLGTSDANYKVTDEIKRIRQLHPVCIFGIEESAATRAHFGEAGAKIITVPGNHHYNDNPSVAAGAIINESWKIRNK
jgi:type IV secretory pathway VirJ component